MMRFVVVFEEALLAVDKTMEAAGTSPSYIFSSSLFGMAAAGICRRPAWNMRFVETGLGGRLDATNAVESPGWLL